MTNFTSMQASYANEVILRLMKEHRFFLFDERDMHSIFKGSDPMLDPDIFPEAWELNIRYRAAFEAAKMAAQDEIANHELELGIKPASLDPNQSLVKCNRYTGGLDIHSAFPATSFLEHMPKSRELLASDILTARMDGESEDEIAPKRLCAIREYSTNMTNILWDEYQKLLAFNSSGEKVAVLLKTRFSPVYRKDGDLMLGKVDGMMDYSKILGYLAYKYSHHHRIVPHNYLITGTSQDGHTSMYHWSDRSKPVWSFDSTANGYSCTTYFLTVL